MRFPWILTLALVAVTVPAGAQKKNKVVVKPSHEEKSAKGGPVKGPAPRSSSSQELQRIEQQTAKSSAGVKSERAHVAPVKKQREKPNAPIHFVSGTGAHGAGSGSANTSKSRVRTHGNKH